MNLKFNLFIILNFVANFIALGQQSGQKCLQDKIVCTADSILNSIIDTNTFKNHLKFDTLTVLINEDLKQQDKIVQKYFYILYDIYINGNLLYTYENAGNAIYGDKATIHVLLDTNLKLVKPVDLSIFPKFILNKEPIKLIDKQNAIELAQKYFKEKKSSQFEAELTYDIRNKYYFWNISNQFYFYVDDPSWEEVFINAINKKFIGYHYVAPFH